jgi:2-amino-4-hydroxy-6-hydroxymethyldihydropteridine diphosphokinase
MHQAYILLGSNVNKERHLPNAIRHLREHGRLLAVSSVYETVAVGRTDQPNFFNAAALLETPLSAETLKWQVLRPIEAKLGRVRTDDPNAPRPIDLDIVLFDEAVFDLDGAPIPDPALLEHAYAALPLIEIAPHYRHPLTGRTLATLTERFAGSPGILRREDVLLQA